MIVIKLIGGLGNQMFQYACAKAIALEHQFELGIDNSAFKEYKVHKYLLNKFNISGNIINEKNIKIVNNISEIRKKILNFINKQNNRKYYSRFVEKKFDFDKNISKITDNTFMEGYFQSEKYFKKYAENIKKDFSLNYISNKTLEIAGLIINTSCSVSLHIRRGDYVSNPDASNFHGLASLDYYYRSIEYIVLRNSNLVVFVFSDDLEWVKKNLKLKYKVKYVSHNDDENAQEDLYLMSLCKHNIIANSTFSWWGAWLNSNKEKIVIAPKEWFKNKEMNVKDLIPEEWICL